MWMYLVLCCILQKTSSIRLVSIHVPERVAAGQGVGLSCFYDLEGDELYSIKWQFDGVEFFRFVPSDKPSRFFFPVKGIQVDLERSGNGTVFIQDVKANTSGTYSCEISAEAPSFQTLQAARMMAVEEMGEFQPNRAYGIPAMATSASVMLVLLILCFENVRRFCTETACCAAADADVRDTHLLQGAFAAYRTAESRKLSVSKSTSDRDVSVTQPLSFRSHRRPWTKF